MRNKFVASGQKSAGSPCIHHLKVKTPVSMFEMVLGFFQKHLLKISMIFLFTCTQAVTVLAQGDSSKAETMSPVEMAGTMRSNGKIYVVVAVLVIILTGLFTYLTRLDRKITRLEKGTWKDT